MESDRRSSFLFCRIFCDEPVSTSSENASSRPCREMFRLRPQQVGEPSRFGRLVQPLALRLWRRQPGQRGRVADGWCVVVVDGGSQLPLRHPLCFPSLPIPGGVPNGGCHARCHAPAERRPVLYWFQGQWVRDVFVILP